jgi:hypothetical protein
MRVSDSGKPSGHSDEELPERLKAVLRNRYGTGPPVPERLDQTILADAHRHLREHVRPKRSGFGRPLKWAAMASLIAAAVLLIVRLPMQDGSPSQLADSNPDSNSVSPRMAARSATVPNDLDGNGRIDILDAFVLARSVAAGQGSLMNDMNHDGRLDQSDVRALAQAAVTL